MQAALQSLDQILQRAQEHEQLPVEVIDELLGQEPSARFQRRIEANFKPPIRLSSPATRASYRLRHRRRGRTGRSVVTDHPQASEVSTFRRRFCPFSRFEPARLATPLGIYSDPGVGIENDPRSAFKTPPPPRHGKRPPSRRTVRVEKPTNHVRRVRWRGGRRRWNSRRSSAD